jgi:hypothetical protein
LSTRFTPQGLVHEHSEDCSHSLDGPLPFEEVDEDEDEDDRIGDLLARLFWQHNTVVDTEDGYQIIGR